MSENNPSSTSTASAESVGSAPTGQADSAPAEQFGAASAEQFDTPAAAPADAPAKKKIPVRLIGSVLLFAAIAVGGWWFSRDDAVNAELGSCLAGTTAAELDANKLKVVECASADAGFKVVGRVEDKAESAADESCNPFQETEYVFWSGKPGLPGVVLCIAEVKK